MPYVAKSNYLEPENSQKEEQNYVERNAVDLDLNNDRKEENEMDLSKNGEISPTEEKIAADEGPTSSANGMVKIGPNGTLVAKKALEAINWSLSGEAITRKILVAVFGRQTLASHTLTGKPSPAFLDSKKPMKSQLEPLKVADVIHFALQHTDLKRKEIRNVITTKCADESKMYRQREKKKQNADAKQK